MPEGNPGGDQPRPYEHTAVATFEIGLGFLTKATAIPVLFVVGEGFIPSRSSAVRTPTQGNIYQETQVVRLVGIWVLLDFEGVVSDGAR
jgi:hypothetical protein